VVELCHATRHKVDCRVCRLTLKRFARRAYTQRDANALGIIALFGISQGPRGPFLLVFYKLLMGFGVSEKS